MPDQFASEEETLSTSNLIAGSPSLAAIEFSQIHLLQTGELTTGIPSVPAHGISEEETFSTSNLITGLVEIYGSTIAQTHIFSSGELTSGLPDVPSIFAFEEETFEAGELQSSLPLLDTADITENNNLSSGDLVSGSHVLGSADIAQDHDLIGQEIESSLPNVGQATAQIIVNMIAANLNSQPTSVPNISMSEEETFEAGELLSSAVIFDDFPFLQIHDLENDQLSSGRPQLLELLLVQGHNFGAENILSGLPEVPDQLYNAALGRIAEDGGNSKGVADLTINDPNKADLIVQKFNSVEISA